MLGLSSEINISALGFLALQKVEKHCTRPTNLPQLKAQIEENIANIPKNTNAVPCKIFRIDLLNVFDEMDSISLK